jgi:hypothetical protein
MDEPQVNVPLLRSRVVPLADRFWQYVDKRGPDDCWPWTGRVNNMGYPMTSYTDEPGARSRGVVATRAAWFLETGSWPVAFMCHTCDNPICVNVAHLFDGDQTANMRDASAKGRLRGRFSEVTQCIHGHGFTPANTYVNPNNGKRACRTCYRTYDLRRKAARHG